MKASTKLTLALCFTLYSVSFSTRITNAAATYIMAGHSLRASNQALSYTQLSFYLGAFVGGLLSWPLSMVLSRKRTIVLSISIAALAAILQTAAFSVVQIQVGYAFTGLANGMVYTVANLWQAENAEARERGERIMLLQVGAAAGYAVGAWIEIAVAMTVYEPQSFRIAMGIQLIWQAITIVLVCYAPESYR